MDSTADIERRRHTRYPLATSVQFYHGPTQHNYPGRCVDISEGGMMMYVPASAPVHTGQPIQLTVGCVNRPEFAGLSENPLDATIVRVNRQALVSMGHAAIGVRFSGL